MLSLGLSKNKLFFRKAYQLGLDGYNTPNRPQGHFYYTDRSTSEEDSDSIPDEHVFDTPEKFQSFMDLNKNQIQRKMRGTGRGLALDGNFGPDGSIFVQAYYPAGLYGNDADSKITGMDGNQYWVKRHVLDPSKNLYIDILKHRGSWMVDDPSVRRKYRPINTRGSLYDPETIDQIHRALQTIGAKTVTSSPISFPRTRLFTQLTDQLHERTGGLGKVLRSHPAFNRRGEVKSVEEVIHPDQIHTWGLAKSYERGPDGYERPGRPYGHFYYDMGSYYTGVPDEHVFDTPEKLEKFIQENPDKVDSYSGVPVRGNFGPNGSLHISGSFGGQTSTTHSTAIGKDGHRYWVYRKIFDPSTALSVDIMKHRGVSMSDSSASRRWDRMHQRLDQTRGSLFDDATVHQIHRALESIGGTAIIGSPINFPRQRLFTQLTDKLHALTGGIGHVVPHMDILDRRGSVVPHSVLREQDIIPSNIPFNNETSKSIQTKLHLRKSTKSSGQPSNESNDLVRAGSGRPNRPQGYFYIPASDEWSTDPIPDHHVFDTPEKFQEIMDSHHDEIQKMIEQKGKGLFLHGNFGPRGSMHIRAYYPAIWYRYADSQVQGMDGRPYWVKRTVLDPSKNFHVDVMRHRNIPMDDNSQIRRTNRTAEGLADQRGSMYDPETINQIHRALQTIGAKTITSTPISFGRRRLFTQITDQFHNRTGGLGEVDKYWPGTNGRGQEVVTADVIHPHMFSPLQRSFRKNPLFLRKSYELGKDVTGRINKPQGYFYILDNTRHSDSYHSDPIPDEHVFDTPEKFQSFINNSNGRVPSLMGNFGPQGSLSITGSFPRYYSDSQPYSKIMGIDGRYYWVKRKVLDPSKNMHITFMKNRGVSMDNDPSVRRREREKGQLTGLRGSLYDPATIDQIHRALQIIGAKTVTSDPLNFARRRLFTQLTDQLHERTGGLGKVNPYSDALDNVGNHSDVLYVIDPKHIDEEVLNRSLREKRGILKKSSSNDPTSVMQRGIGKVHAIQFANSNPREVEFIEINNPEDAQKHRDKTFIANLGPHGMLRFYGFLGHQLDDDLSYRYESADASHRSPEGRYHIVRRKIIDPNHHLFINFLDRVSTPQSKMAKFHTPIDEIIKQNSMANPEVQKEFFEILHRIGAKSVSSNPTSFSRRRLFTGIVDKFHAQTGGLGEIIPNARIFNHKGDVVEPSSLNKSSNRTSKLYLDSFESQYPPGTIIARPRPDSVVGEFPQIINNPEDANEYKDTHYFTSFLGPNGNLKFTGQFAPHTIKIPSIQTSKSGKKYIVMKKVINPKNHFYIMMVTGSREGLQTDRLDSPEVQKQLFETLHKLGAKTTSGSPISFSRMRLFTPIADKFHAQTGGVGERVPSRGMLEMYVDPSKQDDDYDGSYPDGILTMQGKVVPHHKLSE